MPFTNPIVAGLTLIRNAIQSQNFLTGVSGWRINKTGEAEFQELTARGAIQVEQLTVGSGTRSRFITPNIPTELSTFHPNFSFDVVDIWWFDEPDEYFWSAIGVMFGSPAYFEGTYSTTDGVNIIRRTVRNLGGTQEFQLGSAHNSQSIAMTIIDTTVSVQQGSYLLSFGEVGGAKRIIPPTAATTQYRPAATINTTSASYATIGSAPTLVYLKKYDFTDLFIELSCSAWCSGSASTDAEFTVNIDGTDQAMMTLYRFNTTNDHRAIPTGYLQITTPGGILKGTHNIVPRWRRAAGAGTVTMNTDDVVNYTVREVESSG